MLYIMPLLFAFTPILNFADPAGAIWTMVTATVGALAFAAWTLYRPTSKIEWVVLALASILCFLPLDVQNAVPGHAVNLAGWGLLAAVALWQRWNIKLAEGTRS
jgi:hypothetical protein